MKPSNNVNIRNNKMKKVLIILLFFLSVKSTYAKCKGGGFQFYPEQKEISMNSIFIIQGFAKSQKQIVEFNETKVYLVSENGELIELILQKILKGQKDLTQAIFKPEKELNPNTIYYLKHPDKSIDYFTKWNSDLKKREKIHWTTSDVKISKSIKSDIHFEFEKTEVIFYGCGPSVNAIFNIKDNLDSEILYKTEVVNLSNNRTNTFIIKEINGNLNVGHGMCAGAFTFDKTSKYKVRFTPMNIDGNTVETTEWFEFENPFLSEK